MSLTVDTDDQRTQMAQRLRDSREYLGLSQDEVAVALQLSRPAISNIESGSRKVEAIELDKLSRLYGQPVQFFLTGALATAGTKARVEFLARTLDGLSEKDVKEVARFAEFLRRSAKPTSRRSR